MYDKPTTTIRVSKESYQRLLAIKQTLQLDTLDKAVVSALNAAEAHLRSWDGRGK